VIPDPDVTHVKLSKGDAYVIIASDGLWDYVTPAAAGVFVCVCARVQVPVLQMDHACVKNGSSVYPTDFACPCMCMCMCVCVCMHVHVCVCVCVLFIGAA